jgi:hypothetical protein
MEGAQDLELQALKDGRKPRPAKKNPVSRDELLAPDRGADRREPRAFAQFARDHRAVFTG